MSIATVPTRRRWFRFRLRTLLEFPIAFALALSVWPCMVTPVPFSGEAEIGLEFVVVDATDGRTIEDATVRVVDPLHDGKDTASPSGRDGRARMIHYFPMQGRDRTYVRTGTVSFEDCWLEVSAPGHRSTARALSEVAGNRRDVNHPTPPPITISLRPGTDSPGPFAGIAGCYWRDGAPSSDESVTVFPDGRVILRWDYSVGCSVTSTSNLGYARLKDGWLVVSVLKRDIQRDIDQAPTRFFPLLWGERTYLVPSDNMLDFCNAVNQQREPRTQLQGVVYLRADDWKKRVAGLPKLPPQWRPYLLQEPVQGTILDVIDSRRLKLDVGANDGIRPGMELLVQNPLACPLKVISFEPDSCVVDSYSYGTGQLKAGQKVGSRLFYWVFGSAPGVNSK